MLPPMIIFTNSKPSFSGSPGKALDIVLERVGFGWTIVNNALIISRPNDAVGDIPAQFISASSGMLEVPYRFKEPKVKTKKKNSKLVDGWRIRSLIIPSLQPKSLIEVDSKEISGVFLIKKVVFSGDTHTNEWNAEMECLQK